MNAPQMYAFESEFQILEILDRVCNKVSPAWPLDKMIAVNPYWGRADQPFVSAAKTLEKTAHSSLAMPLSYYQALFRQQKITEQHLQAAIQESGVAVDVATLLSQAEENLLHSTLTLLSDAHDATRDLTHYLSLSESITNHVSDYCSTYFDQHLTDWRSGNDHSLYQKWLDTYLTHDFTVSSLLSKEALQNKLTYFQPNSIDQIKFILEVLEINECYFESFLETTLFKISGWASWAAYLRWMARLENADDNTIIDLLAIRLSWEFLIDDGRRDEQSIWYAWMLEWYRDLEGELSTANQYGLIWQRAHEISFQTALAANLAQANQNQSDAIPKVQAAFCIDVRSEVIRRHIESISNEIETIGYAGFFGLPISYSTIGSSLDTPMLPGLLKPKFQITESAGNEAHDAKIIQRRKRVFREIGEMVRLKNTPISSFSYVETMGIGFANQLIKKSFFQPSPSTSVSQVGLSASMMATLFPSFAKHQDIPVSDIAQMLKSILNSMGLKDRMAELVLLIGHTSHHLNNPQKAGLECGACCGQSGEQNAKTLAHLLNDPAIREALKAMDIYIPNKTRFVAGVHITSTDEIELFPTQDDDVLATSRIAQAKVIFGNASQLARQERNLQFQFTSEKSSVQKLFKHFSKRAKDWSQTRPEWGLANNAAFIIAPRARTKGVNLAGRAFLHNYDPMVDTEGQVLEQILTAPLLVTNWINMQYFASCVDPKRFGSGNKTLHNVVGGNIGVLEGNTGDLRIGLAKQSVFDGENWMHEPLRLNAVIDASRERIEAIIEKHAILTNLVKNQWLYIARFGEAGVEFYQKGEWVALN